MATDVKTHPVTENGQNIYEICQVIIFMIPLMAAAIEIKTSIFHKLKATLILKAGVSGVDFQ